MVVLGQVSQRDALPVVAHVIRKAQRGLVECTDERPADEREVWCRPPCSTRDPVKRRPLDVRGRWRSLETLALAFGVVAPARHIERIGSTNPKHHVLVLAALVGIWTSIKAPGVGSLVREAMRETWFGKRPRPASVVD